LPGNGRSVSPKADGSSFSRVSLLIIVPPRVGLE
jgi:hypothetical protein